MPRRSHDPVPSRQAEPASTSTTLPQQIHHSAVQPFSSPCASVCGRWPSVICSPLPACFALGAGRPLPPAFDRRVAAPDRATASSWSVDCASRLYCLYGAFCGLPLAPLPPVMLARAAILTTALATMGVAAQSNLARASRARSRSPVLAADAAEQPSPPSSATRSSSPARARPSPATRPSPSSPTRPTPSSRSTSPSLKARSATSPSAAASRWPAPTSTSPGPTPTARGP